MTGDASAGGTAAALELPATAQLLANEGSRSKNAHLRSERIRLAVLILAAASSLMKFEISVGTRVVHLGAALAGVLLLASLIVELLVLEHAPKKRWMDTTVVQREVEGEAWRFAMGGHRYAKVLADAEAERVFAERMSSLFDREAGAVGVEAVTRSQLTVSMRELRDRRLHNRADAYGARLDAWIRSLEQDAQALRLRDRRLNALARGFQLGTLGAAICQATGLVDFNLIGLGAAITAASLAWRGIRGPTGLSREYARAVGALSLVRGRLATVQSDQDFARIVDGGEDAIITHTERWIAALG